jgi:Predicted nucleic acid-binding protein, contains PIN domain
MPLNGDCLLDTTVVVELLRNNPRAVAFVSGLRHAFPPSVTIGELAYGAENSARREQNMQVVRDIARTSSVLPADIDVAFRYAEIKRDLKRQGKMSPENDIRIATIALVNHIPVATCDKHFAVIQGLETVEL